MRLKRYVAGVAASMLAYGMLLGMPNRAETIGASISTSKITEQTEPKEERSLEGFKKIFNSYTEDGIINEQEVDEIWRYIHNITSFEFPNRSLFLNILMDRYLLYKVDVAEKETIDNLRRLLDNLATLINIFDTAVADNKLTTGEISTITGYLANVSESEFPQKEYFERVLLLSNYTINPIQRQKILRKILYAAKDEKEVSGNPPKYLFAYNSLLREFAADEKLSSSEMKTLEGTLSHADLSQNPELAKMLDLYRSVIKLNREYRTKSYQLWGISFLSAFFDENYRTYQEIRNELKNQGYDRLAVTNDTIFYDLSQSLISLGLLFSLGLRCRIVSMGCGLGFAAVGGMFPFALVTYTVAPSVIQRMIRRGRRNSSRAYTGEPYEGQPNASVVSNLTNLVNEGMHKTRGEICLAVDGTEHDNLEEKMRKMEALLGKIEPVNTEYIAFINIGNEGVNIYGSGESLESAKNNALAKSPFANAAKINSEKYTMKKRFRKC